MNISFQEALIILQEEGVLAMQTDTVYGLLAKADSPKALEKIYRLKKRPLEKKLIVLFDSLESVERYFSDSLPQPVYPLIEKFWPGPLTLVLPKGSTSIAVRVPKAPLLQQLIREAGPLVAPSANLSECPPASSAEEIAQIFSPDFPILLSDDPFTGAPSTLIAYEKDRFQLLREGSLPRNLFVDYLSDPQ